MSTKNIYYSVGQNANDHKSGTPTVSISSGVATFSTAQTANNLGVGDRVDYDTDNKICHLAGKISTTQWNVVTVTGGTPADVTDKTVNSIKHEFTSMVSARSGSYDANHLNTANLVTGDYILNLPCYYDSGPDTSYTQWNGYTTGTANYIRIYTPTNTDNECNQSQRHDGKFKSTAFSMQRTTGTILALQDNHMRVEGLQFDSTNVTSTSLQVAISSLSAGADVRVSECICKGDGNNTSYIHRGIYGYSNNATSVIKLWNNIIYDMGTNSNSDGIILLDPLTAYVYSNTVANCHYGIRSSLSSTNVTAKNNLVFTGGGTGAKAFFGGYNGNSTNNASSDETAPGTSQIDLTSNMITDYCQSASDFHINPSANNADEIIGQAANLSSDSFLAFTNDIDGQTRGTVWDLSADDTIAVPGKYKDTTILFTGDTGYDGALLVENQNSTEAVPPLVVRQAHISAPLIQGKTTNDNGEATLELVAKDSGAEKSRQITINTDGDVLIPQGDVGIGTTSSNAKLEVRQPLEQLRLSHDANHFSVFQVDGAGNMKIRTSGGKIAIQELISLNYQGNNDIKIAPSHDFIVSLTGSRFLIEGSTESYMQVNGDSGATEGNVYIGPSATPSFGPRLQIDDNDTSGTVLLLRDSTPANKLRIDHSPTVTAIGTDGTQRLDLGAKEFNGVADIPDALTLNTNGRVGIGTPDPFATLHIVSTVDQLRLAYDANKFAIFQVDSSGELSINTFGNKVSLPSNEVLTLSGAIGIHVNDPDADLDLAGSMRIGGGSGKLSYVVVDPPTGNGNTDRDNIQNAIDDLPVYGGTVLLQQGTYKINKAITKDYGILLKDGVQLIGCSSIGTILKPNEDDMDVIFLDSPATERAYTSAYIKNLHVDGGGRNDIIGINIDNGSSTKGPQPVYLENVTVTYCNSGTDTKRRIGIKVSSWFAELNNCVVDFCKIGVQLKYRSGGEAEVTNGTRLVHCHIWYHDTAIEVQGYGNQIVGCNIGGIPANKYGIELHGRDEDVSGTYVAGNYIESGDASATGIYVDSKGNTITGNFFEIATAGNEISYSGGSVEDGNVALGNFNFSLTPRRSLDNAVMGKLGIGTFAPTDNFEVYGTGNMGIRINNSGNSGGDFSALRFYQNTAEKAVIFTNNDDLYINRSSTGDLLLNTSGGSVGIGITTPDEKLHVAGSIRIGDTGGSSASSYDINMPSGISTVNSGNGRELYIKAGSSNNAAGKRGGHLYLRPGIPTSPATAYGDVLIADQGGNAAIGSTNADKKLVINGGEDSLGFQNVGTTKWHVGYLTNGLNFAETGQSDGRLFLKDGGSVGVGTTLPDLKLSVTTGSNGHQAIFGQDVNTPGGSNNTGIVIGERDADTKAVILDWNYVDEYASLHVAGSSIGSGLTLTKPSATTGTPSFVGIGTSDPNYELQINGVISGLERTDTPDEPDEGEFIIWMSNGTGKGDDGDVLIAYPSGESRCLIKRRWPGFPRPFSSFVG